MTADTPTDDEQRYLCPVGHWIVAIRDISGEPCPVPNCTATLGGADTDLDQRIRNQRRELARLNAEIERLHAELDKAYRDNCGCL